MRIRVLVVDDELHAREGILLRLKGYDALEVVGECASGEEAVRAIAELKPDLLFLDIQMPEINGFEVLRRVSADHMPIVVFVTAFDKFAVKAFDFHALDYLLKPIGEERFDETVRLALSRVKHRNLEAYARDLKQMVDGYLDGLEEDAYGITGLSPADGGHLDRIAVKVHDRIYVLRADEIDWMESGGDYVYLHADSRKHIVRQTLTSLESKMDPTRFVRIHRSIIVNVDRIKSLRANEHGDYEVYLDSGEKLKMSRYYRAHFQKVIGNSI